MIFKDGQQVSGEIQKPEGNILFSFKGNQILVLEEPSEETEEEFTRYSIYEVIKE